MCWGIFVTTDEELDLLDQQLRRLKIEYEVFFNNPAKRPPTDIEWKVLAIIRKFSDSPRMSFSQRYKYNSMAQRYAIQSDLWRKKLRIREEGYRRPQDAILSVQGVRRIAEPEVKPVFGLTQHAPTPGAEAAAGDSAGQSERSSSERAFAVRYSGAAGERDQIQFLYKILTEAKKKSGEKVSGNLDSFAAFVKKKTGEIRKQHGCEAVEYSVEMQDGQVKLKAKAKA
jgi:hypothetical protein